jgi:predicted RNase H-like HicB family nuclease
MNGTLNLTIAFDAPDEDGWIVARVLEVPGALSQGRTRKEARENVIDALALMLSPEPSAVDDQREREALHLTIAA